MKRRLLHTPEGVRDIYNMECARKMILQENLQKVLQKYGYHAIETPTFEFFDIFSREIGTTPSREQLRKRICFVFLIEREIRWYYVPT